MFIKIIIKKWLPLIAFGVMLNYTGLVQAAGFDGQKQFNNQTLYLNGQGPRKKAFITVYDTALYLTEKGENAKAIVLLDHPMAIALVIESSFASAKRISESFLSGLEQSTGGKTAAIEPQIQEFLAVFELGVSKGDVFEFVYWPDSGVNMMKNSSLVSVIKGLDFKQALFGVWLSDHPVSAKLKAQLLGL